METFDARSNTTVRWSAALFFLVCIPLALWDQNYVPQKIFVPENPVATAANLLANEFSFRTAMVSHLAGVIIFVWIITMFSKVFRPVDKQLSLVMAVAILMLVPISFILELLNYSALMALKGKPRVSFDTAQQQEVAYFLMRMYRYGSGPGWGKLFIGLSFVPFGILIYRSKVVPKIIGVLVIVGGAGYLADCCIAILLQRPDYTVVRSYLKYTTLAYIAALLWFAFKGLGNRQSSINP